VALASVLTERRSPRSAKAPYLIPQYYIKVKKGAQAYWLLAEMGLQDHPQTVRTELDPVDYRLEQISPPQRPISGIGQQALAASALLQPMMREYRPMAAPFVERGLADPSSPSRPEGPRSPACPTDQVRGLKAHGAGF
jgi:hypothetical protein